MHRVGRGGYLAVAEWLEERGRAGAVGELGLQRGPALGPQLGLDTGQACQGSDLRAAWRAFSLTFPLLSVMLSINVVRSQPRTGPVWATRCLR